MDYDLKVIIDGVTVTEYIEPTEAETGVKNLPSITDVRLKDSTSLSGIDIGSCAANSLYFTMVSPFKESFDGSRVEFYISPQSDPDETADELEALIGDETDTSEEIEDEDDTDLELEDDDDGEEVTADEEAEIEEEEAEAQANSFDTFEGEEVPIDAPEETDEGEEDAWIPMGVYYVVEQKSTSNGIALTCLDGFCKMGGDFRPTNTKATLPAFCADLKAQLLEDCGIVMDDLELDEEAYPTVLEWKYPMTYRQAIGYVAGVLGGYATFGMDETVGVDFYTASDTILLQSNMTGYSDNSAGSITITGMICNRAFNPYKRDEIMAGDGVGIYFNNPFVTQEDLDGMLANFNGITYTGAKFRTAWEDNIYAGRFCRVMTEDEYSRYVGIINAIDQGEGDTEALKALAMQLGQTVLITNQTIDFTGQATTTVDSLLNSVQKTEAAATGPTDGKFRALYAEMIEADYIDAVKVVTDGLEAEDAEIKRLVADNIDVNSINGNAIKNSAVLAKALSNELVETITGSKVYYQADTPVDAEEGDIWYKTLGEADNPYVDIVSEYVGGEWQPIELENNGIIRANTITAQEIASNTITANEVNMDNLQTNLARIGDVNGNHIDINEDGIDIISTYGRDMRYETADLKIGNGEMRLDLDMSGGGFAIGQYRLDLYNANPNTTMGIALGASNALKERGIAIGLDNSSTPNEKNVIMLGNGLVATDNNQLLIGEYNGNDQSRGQAIVVANGTSDKRGVVFSVSSGGTVKANNLRTSGGIYTYNHNTPIGTVVTKSLTGTFSVTTSFKSALSIELGAGVWVVYALVSSNSTVSSATNVRCNIYTESAYNYVQVSHYCPSGQYARFTNTTIMDLDEAKTVYLNVVGTAALTLGTNTTLRAVRIA